MRIHQDPGTYVLLLQCLRAIQIEAGGLGELQVTEGWYSYIGSAFGPGGVRARCLRHLRGGSHHWHVDYLRPHCRLMEIWYSHDPYHREHLWARVMSRARGATVPFPRFGSSDCDCSSHLFGFADAPPSFAGFKRRVHAFAPGHSPIHRFPVPVAAQPL